MAALNKMKKKILILYTSVGLGHKYIAENIGWHLERAGFEVRLHDILQVQEGMMTHFGIWIHSFINRRLPFVWRWLYFSNLVNFIFLPLRVLLAKTNSQNLQRIVDEFGPDCILSTQTTGSAAAVSLLRRQQFAGKFVIGFSDYHLHKFWLYDEADLYLANTEEQKQEMIALGIPETKIIVCGITLQPLPVVNTVELRNQLAIPEKNKVVVFGSGSLGIGFDFSLLKEFLTKLTEREPQLSVIVMCGKNEQLKKDLEAQGIINMIPLGFFQQPSRLYQLADLLITKPGGLTIAEALQAGIKILITHTLPGQEEPNYDYLLKRELVIAKPEPLNAQTLADTAIKELSFTERSFPPAAQNITNRGEEGKTLIVAIKNMFHNV